ncbi:MAG TPA: WD40 repeat domain-containing serine/threonine protein kinase [Thermoanaerobaculia bacterium]|jgi:Tol biopolymer transport system component|nr:WD40 repeat domain-containing serine/threonine protein kinase [Thermoanaerobaculia bacterium]
MALLAGTQLGPYEILAPLGAGGMGEVYRARDGRLKREVAIKVLPASYSADRDRLRRFEQEAQAAGALNHPNIMAVHDFGSHDGAPYIVTELLEGETLRARLAGGAIAVRKTIDYAVQISRGLAAAHEKGIIHRDLKPENLFLTHDGRVKILDFGLAKLTQPEDHAAPQTSVPTATAGTEPGVVMGTVGYISPEQIKGKAADQRSDIFSFGAILYEMLSGVRAFQRDSAAETMSAILSAEPPDLSATNKSVSPGLERIVRHCLEKNPGERFHSSSDVAFDLEALSGSGASGVRPESASSARWRRPILAAAAAVAIGLAGIFAGHLIWKAPIVLPPSYHRLTFRRGFIDSGRFAPDGHTVFYAAIWDGGQEPQLFSVRTENPGSLVLDLPSGRVESISRAGEMLILSDVLSSTGYSHRGVLRSAPISGGAARDLSDDVVGADWFPDGRSMALVRAPGWRHRLEFPAGKVLYETAGWITHPRVSPGGDAVAFLDHPQFGDDAGAVVLVEGSGKRTTLSDGWSSVQGLAWSPSGKEIWFTAADSGTSHSLYAVTRTGRRRLVCRSPGGLAIEDIASDGRVLISHSNQRISLIGLGEDSKPRNLSWLEWTTDPILSDDGRTVVFAEEGDGSVYLRKTDGSPALRLGEGLDLALSPDGKWVLAALGRMSPAPLILLPTGAGEPRTLPKDSINHTNEPAAFLPDGRSIVFIGNEEGHGRRTWVQDLDGGKARPITPEGVVGAVLSPDGRFIAARGSDQKSSVYPVEGGPARPIEGLEPRDEILRWSADQRFLFVSADPGRSPARVYRLEVSAGRREPWKEFALPDPAGNEDFRAGAITPDGKTLVYTSYQQLSDLYVVEGLK